MSEAVTEKDETYNGWTNYPTWAVNLWLSKDEPLYRQTLELAESYHKLGRETYEFADSLKNQVEEMLPDLGATFAADLLGYAVGNVDWFEIAQAWLDEAASTDQ
jgi:hypothetical protein